MSQLPVCLLELCKQLQLNALETLPNDRINPQGKQASVVKDYINVLEGPSTALRNHWSFSCLRKKVAHVQGWEMPKSTCLIVGSALMPCLLVLLWDRLLDHLCTCAAGCDQAGTGELLPVLEQGPPPQYSWRPTTPVLMETWEKKRVDKVAMPHGRGSRELPGILTTLECGWGARLSVTYVINYFLTISSVSAS